MMRLNESWMQLNKYLNSILYFSLLQNNKEWANLVYNLSGLTDHLIWSFLGVNTGQSSLYMQPRGSNTWFFLNLPSCVPLPVSAILTNDFTLQI